ncbi:sphinganine kinase lcb4 [Lunasporangiospora selenospora]|uniref:Sphinganine kinase lcb4 n=1 Tax=Lunasporangiospora selenospora TaxID=979761 RepID=A0A9P6FZG0_9FUNG|nr:sphinganine kinase lcb4 [Lunasporangiospora selenospora]
MSSFPFNLQVSSGHHQLQLSYNGQSLDFELPEAEDSKRSTSCFPCGPTPTGYRSIKTTEILNVTIERGDTLVVSACSAKHGPKMESVLEKFEFRVKDQALAAQWQTNVLNHVYKGQGHARRIWETTSEPILRAAECTYDLTYTTHRYHAKEIAKSLDIRQFHAIVCISGDGVLHEVINGLMERPDAASAHKLPLGAIPGGEDHGAHPANATLGIIKGRAMPADLCSITQGNNRYFSFVLQSFGLIADVDLGTEHMRWMGEARFTVAALGKLLSQTTYECELAFIPAETDIKKIHTQYNEKRKQPVVWAEQTHDELDENHATIIDRYGCATDSIKESDGWIVEKDRYITVVGGKMPWISKGSVSHPAVQPNDGLIDLLVFPKDTGRAAGMQIMIGVETGEHVHHEKVRYMKVKAFRVTPTAASGYISIDGEHTPFEPYQVEAHRSLISILSVDGRYARSMKE